MENLKKEFPERTVTMEIFPKKTKKLSNSWLNPWRTLTFETVRESIQKGDFILFGHRLLNKMPLSLFYCNLLVQNPDGGSPRCYLLSLLRPLVISGELRNSWRITCRTRTPTPAHGSRTVWPKSCLQIATECLPAATHLEKFRIIANNYQGVIWLSLSRILNQSWFIANWIHKPGIDLFFCLLICYSPTVG